MNNLINRQDTENIQVSELSETSVSISEKRNNTSSNGFITRKDIEELGNRVRATDTDGDLELFCYTKCSQDDSELLKSCRGIVFNGTEIVMQAFPYTVEIPCTKTELIDEKIDVDKFTFFESHEGALIRMFHFNNKWYTSTHRKLNAFRSKWASRESFGTMFKKALTHMEETNEKFKNRVGSGEDNVLTRFQETLDKEKQYMFLVRHSQENRIVCQAPEHETVYHVGTFVNGKLNFDEDIAIPYPERHVFSDTREVVEFVQNADITSIQGIICFSEGQNQIKILNQEYIDLFNIRGNEPSIKFRYLQVRMKPKQLSALSYLYPEMTEQFDEIENMLYSVARNIYNAYVQRFIKKKFVTMPTEDYIVMRECHTWHEQDRVNNRISMDKVINVMNCQKPTSLNKMLRRYKNQLYEQKKVETLNEQRARSTTSSSDSSPTSSLRGPIVSLPFTSPLVIPQSPTLFPNEDSITL
jgi:hypothetical protein